MSGDDFKRVGPGEGLGRIPTEAYNGMLDAAEANRAGGATERPGERRSRPLPSGVCHAYNASGEQAPWRGICELAGTSNTAAQVEFVQPGQADGVGQYGVLLEPVGPGSMGRVALSGGPWPVQAAGTVSDFPAGAPLTPDAGSWYPRAGVGPLRAVKQAQDADSGVIVQTALTHHRVTLSANNSTLASVTVHNGGDGDFTSIHAALEFLRTAFGPVFSYTQLPREDSANIQLLSGHVCTGDDVRMVGGDYSWIDIYSEDSTVDADGMNWTMHNAQGPRIQCQFTNMGTFDLRDGASVLIEGGVTGCDVRVDYMSRIRIDGEDFDSLYLNSTSLAILENGSFSGQISVGSGSVAHIESTVTGTQNQSGGIILPGATGDLTDADGNTIAHAEDGIITDIS